MDSSYPEVVVAGLDGSDAAMFAAHWAAEDAMRRGLTLRLVHVMTPSADGDYLAPQLVPSKVSDATRRWTRSLLHEARSTLLAEFPGLQVETVSSVGAPAAVLLTQSRQSTVTVVGTHGGGRLSDALFGSVGAHLASHTRGRVVFVPAERPELDEGPSPWRTVAGPVVVGVDGSAHTEAAIAFAFEEAAVRRSLLVALHTWNDKPQHEAVRRPHKAAIDGIHDQRHRNLVELTGRWSARYPTVPVRSMVLHGRPIPTLLGYLHEGPDGPPQLLVVGGRTHVSVARLLLGTTGSALVRSASCPVAIVQGEPNQAFVLK